MGIRLKPCDAAMSYLCFFITSVRGVRRRLRVAALGDRYGLVGLLGGPATALAFQARNAHGGTCKLTM